MAVITLSDAMAWQIGAGMRWGQRRFELTSRSPFGAQDIELGAPLWTAEFTVAPMRESRAGAWKALMLSLAGRLNQLQLWDTRRPAPIGTMRGAMTLASAAAAGATTLSVTAGAGQASKTLVRGDYLQLGSGATQQVVMVMEDSTANGAGTISLTVQPPLRNAHSLAAGVTWDRPKALFRREQADSTWEYSQGLTEGFALTLVEDWRP